MSIFFKDCKQNKKSIITDKSNENEYEYENENNIKKNNPQHCSITKEDTINRFFIIPGSSSRSEYIATKYLRNLKIKKHPRGHHLYLGNIKDTLYKVGVISTGMGCPSLDIIVSELIHVGAKYFIRIGTAGSFDLKKVKIGDIVVATAAVKDDSTSSVYSPVEFPAMADRKLVNIIDNCSQYLNLQKKIHFGIVHTKSSLMAREFHCGYLASESKYYMNTLKSLGVLASEMESSHLFILGSTYNVKMASILVVVGGEDSPFSNDNIKNIKMNMDKAINLALNTIRKSNYKL